MTRADDLAHCRAAIRTGSLSFHAASRLLPARVRDPALVLYAFCRLADDEVDEGTDKASAVLRLRDRLDLAYAGRPRNAPEDRAFAAIVETFEMPRALPEALLEGLAWDAVGRRYATLSGVRDYSARVAAAVGAMMCVLMRVRDGDALARACDLGVAMQLTNIARDVGEDAREGRLYLPLDWLRAEGIDPDGFLAAPAHGPALGRVVAGLPDHGMPFLRRNTALALLALDELESRLDLQLVPDRAGEALGNLFLPGRYQQVLTRPDWIFDTAHNTQALTASLERFLARPQRGRRVLLLGGMRDKTWDAEVLDLIDRVDEVMLTPISLPRSRSREELEILAQAWTGATVAADLGRALADLTARLSPDDAVLVTGSCFLVAETLYLMGSDTLDSTLPVREAASVTLRSNT